MSRADVEAAWAAEANRRWEAYQRGEEEMLDFEAVMAEIRAGFTGEVPRYVSESLDTCSARTTRIRRTRCR